MEIKLKLPRQSFMYGVDIDRVLSREWWSDRVGSYVLTALNGGSRIIAKNYLTILDLMLTNIMLRQNIYRGIRDGSYGAIPAHMTEGAYLTYTALCLYGYLDDEKCSMFDFATLWNESAGGAFELGGVFERYESDDTKFIRDESGLMRYTVR